MNGNLGIVTGAAGGIGRATAEKFAAEGWSLVLVDIDERVKEVSRGLTMRAGQSAVSVVADVTGDKGIAAVDAAVKASGLPLRFLGLIAGTLQKVGPVESQLLQLRLQAGQLLHTGVVLDDLVRQLSYLGHVAGDLLLLLLDEDLKLIQLLLVDAFDLGEGLAVAVDKVGVVLAEHFPRSANDRNELPDRLIEV